MPIFCGTVCTQGWHSVDDGLAVEVGGQDLVSLWKMTAPYMARIIAIIKHSGINLHIINTALGQKIIKFLDMVGVVCQVDSNNTLV